METGVAFTFTVRKLDQYFWVTTNYLKVELKGNITSIIDSENWS